jgi:hypothetical protein
MSLTLKQNKLERLSLTSFSNLVLNLQIRLESTWVEHQMMADSVAKLEVLPTNIKLENIARKKRSNLLWHN